MTCPHDKDLLSEACKFCPPPELSFDMVDMSDGLLQRGPTTAGAYAWSDEPPFIAGSPTSYEASQAIKPTAANLRERVFAYIRDHGPCTDEQIAQGLGMNPSTERPRRCELARDGRIVLAARSQLTSSGRKAQAWTTVPENDQGF